VPAVVDRAHGKQKKQKKQQSALAFSHPGRRRSTMAASNGGDNNNDAPSAKEVFVETDPGIGEFTYRWPRPGLTVDVVLVAAPGVAPTSTSTSTSSSSSTSPSSALLLIERKRPPGQGRWALAGGFVNEGEPLGEAAARELKEETGVEVVAAGAAEGGEEKGKPSSSSATITIDQLRAYGDPGRDPRGWTATVAFAGVARDDSEGKNRRALAATAGGDDASDARWFPLSAPLPAMAFDHKVIVRDALRKLVKEEEEKKGGERDEVLVSDMKGALESDALRGDWDRAF